MPRLERDPRPLHDQLIEHDLVGLDERTLVALLIVELRRMRQQIADLAERVDGGPDRSAAG